MMIFNLIRGPVVVGTAVVLLAGCGEARTLNALPQSPLTIGVPSSRNELSGEALSSSKATSHCSGGSGTFEASGKASGPFPGKFTARGKITSVPSSGLITYHERFEIKSGSRAIDGSAQLQPPSSGSPVYGCSKKGEMAFDNPIIVYRVKKSHARGSGSSSLSNGSFQQNFE